MDTCCATSCKNTANIQDRLKELRGVIAKDSIHFVSGGYVAPLQKWRPIPPRWENSYQPVRHLFKNNWGYNGDTVRGKRFALCYPTAVAKIPACPLLRWEFEQSLLAGYIQLRNWLIRTLVQRGLKNFKVMDTCCATSCKNTANIQDRLKELRGVTAKDSIHFVSGGYLNMAMRTLACLAAMLDTPRKTQNPGTHFWRGFKSVRGSLTGKLGFANHHKKIPTRGGALQERGPPIPEVLNMWKCLKWLNTISVERSIVYIHIYICA